MQKTALLLHRFPRLPEEWILHQLQRCGDLPYAVREGNESGQSLDTESPNVHLIAMKELREIALLRTIREQYPADRILIWWFGKTLEQEEILELLNAGAGALLADQHDCSSLLNALNDLRSQGYHVNELVHRALFSACKRKGLLRRNYGPDECFREREIRSIELRKSGMTSREIADRLFLSKKTVDKLFYELYRKYDCRNFLELLHHYETRRA